MVIRGSQTDLLDGTGVQLDTVFAKKVFTFCQKSIPELERFEVCMNQLQKSRAVKASMRSEVTSLNDIKNCEQHHTKI